MNVVGDIVGERGGIFSEIPMHVRGNSRRSMGGVLEIIDKYHVMIRYQIPCSMKEVENSELGSSGVRWKCGVTGKKGGKRRRRQRGGVGIPWVLYSRVLRGCWLWTNQRAPQEFLC